MLAYYLSHCTDTAKVYIATVLFVSLTCDTAHSIGTRNILPIYSNGKLAAESNITDPQILVFCMPDSKLIVRRSFAGIYSLSPHGMQAITEDTPEQNKSRK